MPSESGKKKLSTATTFRRPQLQLQADGTTASASPAFVGVASTAFRRYERQLRADNDGIVGDAVADAARFRSDVGGHFTETLFTIEDDLNTLSNLLPT